MSRPRISNCASRGTRPRPRCYNRGVGTFDVSVGIGDPQGRRFETIEALVDTGSTYLTVPRPLLESLGVQAVGRRPLTLADSRTTEYEVGMVPLSLEGQTLSVLCVFGDPGSKALLGPVTLETFGLAVDPVRRRLVPVPGLLM